MELPMAMRGALLVSFCALHLVINNFTSLKPFKLEYNHKIMNNVRDTIF